MKNLYTWAIVCLSLFFALPAVGQDWVQKQVIEIPQETSGTINTTKWDFGAMIPTVIGNDLFLSNTHSSTPTGSALYHYKKINNQWVYKSKIVSGTVGTGRSVSIFGKYLVVAGHYNVVVFENFNDSWTQIQTIIPTTYGTGMSVVDGCIVENFGIKVVIYQDIIFIGAPNEECFGDFSIGGRCNIANYMGTGCVYVYKKGVNGLWNFVKKFKDIDCANSPLSNSMIGHYFEVKQGWLILPMYDGIKFYKIDECLLNNWNCSSNKFIRYQSSQSQPFITYYNSLQYRRSNSANMYSYIVYNSNNKNEIHTYKLIGNSWFQQGIKKENSLQSNKFTITHTDKLMLVPTYLHSSTHQYIKTYKNVNGLWVLGGRLEVPNQKFFYNPVEIIDDDNILCNGSKVQGNDTINVIYHFQKTRGNIIKGKVYHDLNANCQKEAGEVGKEYYTIKAEPGGYITSTDENGNYELEVGAGTYTISQVIPQAKGLSVTQLCPAGAGTHTVTFNGLNNEVSGYDFGNNVKECTSLTVDITARRRRCFRNQTIVKYENEGVVTANNAHITVTFPEYVVPLSSTNPWVNVTGNTYKFNVGTLQAGQSGQFIVTDSVACVPNIVGLIQCTEAKIYPKNTCSAPAWNGASLEIVGKCLNTTPHKGRFVLRNVGTASLQSAYKIWRGNTQILNNTLTLAQGDSLVLEIPTDGENLFIQANQAVGHPDGAMVSAAVMNCGILIPVVQGSSQIKFMFLPNDEYANSEMDCMPIVDSYDPNDKAVSPAGITEHNYVKPNTELEFKIRFQNMGTAEAVNIVVIDTLSQHLDLTTFQMASVSHPYKLKFERVNGKQVAFWTFTDINLPAKSINEPASHGYIKFKIKHLPTLVEGTIIKNFADIYFDFNEPVRTNETQTNMTDYQFPVVPIDYCNLFAKAQAGQARTVCSNSFTLEGNTPTMGRGTWTRLSGAGEIAEPNKPNATATNLAVGDNVFKWTLTGVPDCANTESTVTIKRLPDASVSISNNAINNIICAQESVTFTAQASNIGNAPIYQWKLNGTNVGTNLPTFATNSLQNLDKLTLEVQTNLSCGNPPKVISQTVEMTVKAKPAKPAIAHTSLYELKSSVEGDSYLWYKDNTLITNNLPTLRVDKLGKYKVMITKNGCSSPTSEEFVLNSESLQRFADLVEVKLFPNPTSGKVTLNIINNQGSAIDIQVYNNLGKIVSTQRVEASETIDSKVVLDLTNYGQGIYHAKITNQFGLQTIHKIVVQNP